MIDKFLNTCSLAKRAGHINFGAKFCEKAILQNDAKLIIFTADMSDNLLRKLINLCEENAVDYLKTNYSMAELGRCISSLPVACVAISDTGLSKALLKRYNELQNGGVFI